MFWQYIIKDLLMDRVEEGGSNRSNYAVAQFLNLKYQAKYAPHAIGDYVNGRKAPTGLTQLQILEAAGLAPMDFIPFAEFEVIRADKRSNVRHVVYYALVCHYWAKQRKINVTPWQPDGYISLVGQTDLSDDAGYREHGLRLPADMVADIQKDMKNIGSGWVSEDTKAGKGASINLTVAKK